MSVPAQVLQKQSVDPTPPPASSPLFPPPIQSVLGWLNRWIESFVPPSCARDPDLARRARLVAHFGVQGSIFGPAYAIFYFLIGHHWGAIVIVACSLVFMAVPELLRRTENLNRTGHLLVGTMATGFTLLTLIEGGLHGHAIAWLASVPLCALLVLGRRRAIWWSVASVVIATGIALATVWGWHVQPFYDPKWADLVEAAGNIGLIVFLFMLGLVFEVSRRRAFGRMQESLDEQVALNEKLAHLNNEKTEFLGMAAHDLRNPLSVIIGFADLLAFEKDERVVKMAQDIRKGGSRMLSLVNDLLDSNAIEEGAYARELERTDLAALTKQCIASQHASSERKRIGVQLICDGPCYAMADPKAALQVFDNLFSNALKYSPLDSVVQIHVRVDGEWCEWAVENPGQGITAEDKQRLFQKHAKLSARPTGGEQSVGLGLSIVKRLVEAMQGTIACESEPGVSTTFSVRLRAA